jgi:nitrite reductase (NADH) large subunit
MARTISMQYGITLHKGKQVTEIDRVHRRVVARDGTSANYDRLLLATGSNPFMIPVPGKDKEGVILLRGVREDYARLVNGYILKPGYAGRVLFPGKLAP